jgi:urease accessory protein
MSMQVDAAVDFERGGDGSTRVGRLSCAPPLVFRETSAGLLMVGAAGGPLGGDRWTLRISCAPGTRARVGSVAATVAQPGRQQAESAFEVSVDLAAGALLVWSPEPVVVTEGSVHRSRIDVDLAVDATLSWRDVVVLGRHARPAGRSITRWRVRRGSRPFFAHDLDIGPGAPLGWDGPAVLDSSRVVGNLLIVDPAWAECAALPPDTLPTVSGATLFALAGPAVFAVARGATTVEVAAGLDAAENAVREALGAEKPNARAAVRV